VAQRGRPPCMHRRAGQRLPQPPAPAGSLAGSPGRHSSRGL